MGWGGTPKPPPVPHSGVPTPLSPLQVAVSTRRGGDGGSAAERGECGTPLLGGGGGTDIWGGYRRFWGADVDGDPPPPPPHTHPMFSSPPQAWRSLTPWIRPRLGGTGTPPDSQEKGTQPPPALSTPKIWHLGGRTRNPSASHTQLPHIALRNPPPPHIHPPKYPPITCREGGTRSPPPPRIHPPIAAPDPSIIRREGGTRSTLR